MQPEILKPGFESLVYNSYNYYLDYPMYFNLTSSSAFLSCSRTITYLYYKDHTEATLVDIEAYIC